MKDTLFDTCEYMHKPTLGSSILALYSYTGNPGCAFTYTFKPSAIHIIGLYLNYFLMIFFKYFKNFKLYGNASSFSRKSIHTYNQTLSVCALVQI